MAYGFRGLRVASDDAGRLFAFSQLAMGFGSIASSAVIATLAAILAILEDKLGKN
jgi:hypothetical protein